MKKKLVATTLFLTLALTSGTSWAGQKEADLKLKSESTAAILALDPIPGDALFYAGKPVHGVINVVIGLPGAFLFWGFLGAYLNCDSQDDYCGLAAIPMMGGAILYFPMLIWDGIGGIRGVKKHNERVQKHQTSIWNRVQPSLAVTNEGAFGGVRVTF